MSEAECKVQDEALKLLKEWGCWLSPEEREHFLDAIGAGKEPGMKAAEKYFKVAFQRRKAFLDVVKKYTSQS